MGFLKKMAGLIFGSAPSDSGQYYYVRCRRCGEIIRVRLNAANEASAEYDESGNTTGYIYRKVLIGRGRCFQAIEVSMGFDAQRKLLSREVKGGEFVTEEEYNQATEDTSQA